MYNETNLFSSLQLYAGKQLKNSGGQINTIKLKDALVLAPATISTLVSYSFAMLDPEYKSPLQLLLGGSQNKIYVKDQIYRWKIEAQMETPSNIIKFEAANATYPGLNSTPVYIWIDSNWFNLGSILVFDNLFYTAHVYNEPVQDGDLYKYTVYAIGGPQAYIPTQYLAQGSQVSNGSSAYPEFSEQGDTLQYQTPFEMQNQLTISSMEWSITGSAYETVVDLSLEDKNTKVRQHIVADGQNTILRFAL